MELILVCFRHTRFNFEHSNLTGGFFGVLKFGLVIIISLPTVSTKICGFFKCCYGESILKADYLIRGEDNQWLCLCGFITGGQAA